MVIFTLILALAFAIVAVIFALENPMLVSVSLLDREVEGSLALFILLAVIVGIIIGMLVMVPGMIRNTLELRSHRKRIGGLEKSLDEQKVHAPKAGRLPSMPEPLTDFPQDDKE